MPKNKNAAIRYQILDKCFRNTGRRYAIEDLVEEISNVMKDIDPRSRGISTKQVYNDISHMESSEGWSIDLERITENRKVYFRYVDPSYSIFNMPLSEIEIEQLRSALDILTKFKGMPQFTWIGEMIGRLNKRLMINDSDTTIIDFDSNQYLTGIEHIGVLYNAIHYKKVIQVKYRPFESEIPHVWHLHPYYLKQYNNRWFIFGHCQDNSALLNLALDRIEEIKETGIAYIESDINWSEFFDDIVGVTKPEGKDPERIVLEFYGKQGYYIETKPIHPSQISKWIDKNVLKVTLNLIINHEFESILLTFADKIKIVEPSHLADTISKRLQNALLLNSAHYKTYKAE